MADDIVYPVIGGYLLKPQEIAKLIEGHTSIKEYPAHHVPLAAIKAVGGVLHISLIQSAKVRLLGKFHKFVNHKLVKFRIY